MALEAGHLVHFPTLAFALQLKEEQILYTVAEKITSKNISLDERNKLSGLDETAVEIELVVKQMMRRFRHDSTALVKRICPRYAAELTVARTSFRPQEVSLRVLSPRKDDRRLHRDAFPWRTTSGSRILRLFCNINPWG